MILAAFAETLGAARAFTAPVSFEPNQGQIDARVKYLGRDQGATLWFTQEGPVLGIAKKGGQAVLKIRFEGGNPSPKIEGEAPQGGASNYFIGSDPARWRTHVPHFGKVRYHDVYPGIDVVFYGNPQKIEYDFVVAPGADPSRIRLAFDGVDRLTEVSGDLVLKTGGVEIRNRKPAIYQGDKIIEGRYVLRGKRRAGFVVDRYDSSQPLVIDPVLTYATYLGGSNGDGASGTAIDAQGNVIVVGHTNSTNFPTRNALYGTYGGATTSVEPALFAFITKFNPSASGGASVVFSTFFGGVEGTAASAVALDKSGNIFVTGFVTDGAIPLKNAFQSTFIDNQDCAFVEAAAGATNPFACADAFVAEFSAAGDQLLFSSLLGGSSWDEGDSIAVDASGNMYVAGTTYSVTFPVRGQPYQTSLEGAQNAFLSMISPSGALVYSTIFGENATGFSAVAVDSSGMVYADGFTSSAQIATTPGAFEKSLPGALSAIVAKFNLALPGTQALVYCTYLGGSGGTIARGIAVDNAGSIYVAGTASEPDFPTTPGAAQTTYGGVLGLLGSGDGFVAKLNPAAQGAAQLVYSSYIGGSFDDDAVGVAVDSAGRITVAGITNSFDFPVTPDAFQCCFVGVIQQGYVTLYGFISRFDPSKSGSASLVYSTLLGGASETELFAIAMDAPGNAVAVVGSAVSDGTPVTAGAFQPKFGGQGDAVEAGDAYVARFDFSTSGPVVSNIENGAGLSAISAASLSPGLIFTLKGSGLGPAVGVGPQLDPSTGLVANNVSGVQVLVNNIAAPLIYVSATQINAVAPYELAGKLGAVVNIQVVYNSVPGTSAPVTVAATAPGIFSFDDGSGQGAIRNQDQSVNGAGNPASIGSVISIYATGEGQTTPAGVDGALANEPVSGIPAPVASHSVTIGGMNAPIQYIGTAPGGIAGFLQINVTVPAGVTPGAAIPVLLTIGGVSSQAGLTMAIH